LLHFGTSSTKKGAAIHSTMQKYIANLKQTCSRAKFEGFRENRRRSTR